ncbi:outer membrane transport energization protein ExbB [Rhizobium sp. RU20A]|uniref:tonB-system energizer ExbB n=1 Tax=Rhizobium sp. RU20A TaxID=1907412 RepID=UPI0009573473|nr:tonB-system energizer ExbB [Rhizobium sp. RU20A]SIQ01380.1 outer membrane transport energization protein ExbB [Rhizobium sp. RU20A]
MRLLSVVAAMVLMGVAPVLAQTTSQPTPVETQEIMQEPVVPAQASEAQGTDAAASIPQATGASQAQSLPHDLSPLGMFLAADIIVKGVMILLAFASVVTWAVFFLKSIEIALARRRVRRAAHILTHSNGLTAAAEHLTGEGTARSMVLAAGDELARSEAALDRVSPEGVKERVSSRLARIEAGAGKKIAIGTGILATIGSISPFVGLFGTVWGIMNSFIGISQAQTTNLAVVAPGIAEALLATAIGLVAAIPAVVIYNVFARAIATYRVALADARAAVERLVSRDLDFRAAGHPRERRTDAGLARIG